MSNHISILTAFGAGILSFISPCVLPLVPAYLTYISGVSIDALKGETAEKGALRKVVINTLFFILGFTIVFASLGATASFLGKYLLLYKREINIVGGIIVIILGIHLTGIFRIKMLDYEKRFHVQDKPLGLIGSIFIGAAFAFGWTPCIGPILSGILLVAADQGTIRDGIILLVSYSMGLGLPFLLTGIGLNYALTLFKAIKRHYKTIELVSGSLLIVLGILMATNQFTRISGWLSRFESF